MVVVSVGVCAAQSGALCADCGVYLAARASLLRSQPQKRTERCGDSECHFQVFWCERACRLCPPRQPGTRCCWGDSALCHRSPCTFSGSIAFRVADGQMTAAPLHASGNGRGWGNPVSPICPRFERFTFFGLPLAPVEISSCSGTASQHTTHAVDDNTRGHSLCSSRHTQRPQPRRFLPFFPLCRRFHHA